MNHADAHFTLNSGFPTSRGFHWVVLLQNFPSSQYLNIQKPVNIGQTQFTQSAAHQNESFMTTIPFTNRQIDIGMHIHLQLHLNNSQPRTPRGALSGVTKAESKQSTTTNLEG
jgi:hypothetical protein